MTAANYEYLYKNYKLPIWFDSDDIDWVRYYPMKNGKIYEYNNKRTIEQNIKEEVCGFNTYIYDDEKTNIHEIFRKYLYYKYAMDMKKIRDDKIYDLKILIDLTDEEMQKLLAIKICDYDWTFMWTNPYYDEDSTELLLQLC